MVSTNLPLILLLVLVSISVAFGYSLTTRDVFSKQEDNTYVMATNDQGSSMIVVEDLAKTRSLQALVDGSKVVVNKAVPKRRSTKSSTKSSKKKKQKSNKNQKKKKSKSIKAGTAAGIIFAAFVIICVLSFFYLRHKREKAQRIAQEKINGSSSTTFKTEVRV